MDRRITVGTIGHQGHGKSTLTQALIETAKAQGRHACGNVEINQNWPSGPRLPYSPDPGGFPIRQDITVLPADQRDKKMGWVIYEEVGIVVINDYAVSRIEVDNDREQVKES
jgi:ABC-type dipeptide/oligopeptide/nickel transport system ATPase component